MTDIDPEVEQLLFKTVEKISSQNYRRDRLEQGLFLMAIDLKKFMNSRHQSNHEIVNIVDHVLSDQPDWIRNEIDSAQLPSGFANSVKEGEIQLHDFDDSRVDHEFLMYPGQDFGEVLIRQYHPVICGDHSIQSLSHIINEGANPHRDAALTLFSGIAAGNVVMIPVIAVYTLYLVEKNIDKLCEKYNSH
jgi:hypothetical protein